MNSSGAHHHSLTASVKLKTSVHESSNRGPLVIDVDHLYLSLGNAVNLHFFAQHSKRYDARPAPTRVEKHRSSVTG